MSRGNKSWRWPMIVIGLLATHVVAMVTVVMVATRDGSFAVTPNYYEKALNWDKAQEQKRASERLGWKVEITTNDRGELEVRLVDREGRGIADAEVQVSFYHHAHANELVKLLMKTDGDGRAVQKVTLRHSGLYQFECTAKANQQTYSTSMTQIMQGGG